MSNPDKAAPQPALRALIYNRVSADPRGKRVSVESQDRENHAYCAREGWTVVGVITDNNRSASRYKSREREGYAEVYTALQGKTYGRVDVLVCWESSRAQRGLGEYVEFRDLCDKFNVLFAYQGRAYDLRDSNDRLATGLQALIDEQEAEKIRNRILRSHRDSAVKGEPRGTIPYGYMRTYDASTGHLQGQFPDPQTAPVVQGIVRRLLAGDTLYSIAKDLNAREVPTPRQYRDRRLNVSLDRVVRGWSPTQIRHLLGRESLMGIRTHRGEDASPAKWEPIVRPADWHKVQEILNDPLRFRAARGVRPVHLLSGIAQCGVCESWMRPMKNRGRMTYYCAGSKETTAKGHVSRSAENLDGYVTAYIVTLLSRPDFLDTLRPKTPDEDNEAVRVQRDIEDIEANLAEYERLARNREITPTSFARIQAGYLQDIEALRKKLTPTWIPKAVTEMSGEDAAARWEAASLEGKRTVLRALVKILVHPVGAGVRGRLGVNPDVIEIRSRH